MIRYVGGKTRLAKEIAAIIQSYIQPRHTHYYEPFFGGGSMAEYTKAFGLSRIASDNHCDLIYMYIMLQMGWMPPMHIPESLYNAVKDGPFETMAQKALRGYVGFSMSFGGKYFGGFARDKASKRQFDVESYNRLVNHIPDLKGIYFHCMDYRHFFPIDESMIIYADPPYAYALGYKTGEFDTNAFWQTVRDWNNKGATVIISEYEAPDDFQIIWETPYKTYGITLGATKDKVERLFMMKGQT